MNCLQAQSKITSYIENTLNDNELLEFIQHINSCPNCKEELEVYYTLIVGMKQLDNNEGLSNNFSKELDEQLVIQMERIKSKRRLITQSKICASTILCLILVFTLFQAVKLVGILSDQSRNKTSQQSKYYYTKMKPYMFHPYGYTLRNPYNYNFETPNKGSMKPYK